MRHVPIQRWSCCIIAAAIVLFALTGCAATPTRAPIAWPDAQSKIPEGQALVYFVRPSAFAASAQTYEVSVDGIKVAQLRTGHFASRLVPPGHIRVIAKTSMTAVALLGPWTMVEKPTLELDVDAGSLYFVNIGVSFWGAPTLESVPPNQGQKLVDAADETPPAAPDDSTVKPP